jgi:hypothetical protein
MRETVAGYARPVRAGGKDQDNGLRAASLWITCNQHCGSPVLDACSCTPRRVRMPVTQVVEAPAGYREGVGNPLSLPLRVRFEVAGLVACSWPGTDEPLDAHFP